MKDKLYIVFCLISALFFTAVTMPAFAASAGGSWEPTYPGGGGGFGGASSGGSWGNSDGFGGSGGFGGGSYDPWADSPDGQICGFRGAMRPNSPLKNIYPTYNDACISNGGTPNGTWKCVNGSATYTASERDRTCINGEKPPPPSCPDGQIHDGNSCVPALKCPSGYEKQGNNCVWQCPEGFKEVGGSCVPDNQPEDCDPSLQECDEDGKPKCDPCSKLQELINNNLTMINNDNRVISLTETLVSNQNTTNNNLNTVNNNLNTINNNMSTINNNINNINETINNVITAIEENKPNFDTSGIESKLDEVITAIQNNNGVGSDGEPIDLGEILRLLNEIDQGVKDGKFDDTQLNAYFDEILQNGIPVGVNFEPVTERQDEQTSLLQDIKKLLLPTNEAGDPSIDLPEVPDSENVDLWAAIRGFDISQNRINASKQCPSDKSFSVMGANFSIPMTPMCNFLGYLAPVFLMLGYFQGAMIILRSGD